MAGFVDRDYLLLLLNIHVLEPDEEPAEHKSQLRHVKDRVMAGYDILLLKLLDPIIDDFL